MLCFFSRVREGSKTRVILPGQPLDSERLEIESLQTRSRTERERDHVDIEERDDGCVLDTRVVNWCSFALVV